MTRTPEYRLCAIDLDETLLGCDHTISARNQQAVRGITRLGVEVVIASGRMHEATLRYALQLGLQSPIISYNGALAKLPGTGEEWMHQRIPARIARQVMEFCAVQDLQLNFYFEGRIHSERDTPWLQLYHSRTGSPYVIEPDLIIRMRDNEPTKLVIVDSVEKTNSLLPGLRDRYVNELYVTKTTDEYLELMPASANKGAALKFVADRLGIPREQTIAIGDSYNDIPMIKWAGLGLAVENAKADLIAAADRVIGRSNEDGVAVALEELFELRGQEAHAEGRRGLTSV